MPFRDISDQLLRNTPMHMLEEDSPQKFTIKVITAAGTTLRRLQLGCDSPLSEVAYSDARSANSYLESFQRVTYSTYVAWDQHDVCEWLGKVGLGNMASVFLANGIHGA